MTFLSDPQILMQEFFHSEAVAIVEFRDHGAERAGPSKLPSRSTVVPMRAVIPSLKKRAKRETSEFDRDFSW